MWDSLTAGEFKVLMCHLLGYYTKRIFGLTPLSEAVSNSFHSSSLSLYENSENSEQIWTVECNIFFYFSFIIEMFWHKMKQ